MNRIADLFMFAAIVTGVYFVMNWYVLGRLAHLFGIKKTFVFYIAVAALAASLLTAIVLDMRVGNWLTGLILKVTTMWVGVCFLFVWCLVALQAAGWVVKMPPTAAGVGAIAVVGVATLYAMANAVSVHVRKVEIPAPVYFKIAQISDIHIGSVGGGFFSGVIDKVNELKPDAVLITGDLVDNNKAATAAALENLNRLAVPVFFVSGNHERYVGYDNVARLLASTRVRWLRNEAVTCNNIRIVGIDDNVSSKTMDEALSRVDGGTAYTILMYHRPEWFNTAASRNVNLMLTGHTHRGQIWPFNFVVGSIYEYIDGLHEIDHMYLYVSTGTGTWGPRMRLGSHSEIVMIELKAAQ
jgi:predicted MPP superfamily phosphohydrolase